MSQPAHGISSLSRQMMIVIHSIPKPIHQAWSGFEQDRLSYLPEFPGRVDRIGLPCLV